MIQGNYFLDNQDLQNYVEKFINWEEIITTYEQNFADHKEHKKTKNELLAYAPSNTNEAIDTYKITCERMGEIAGSMVAPVAAEMDKEGLKFKDGKVTFPEAMIKCYEKVNEAGLGYYALSRHYGGLSMPVSVQTILLELLSRSDSSFALCVAAPNIAEIIEHYADEDLVKEWIPKVTEGKYWSAMALTEPNYGSDLSNLRVKATRDENGKWKITGTKRFITHGCGFNETPALILTLARTGEPTSGARGLSFFLVKGTDVEIGGIEKKMGIHCSPTCEVIYDNSPAILIGSEGRGLVKYAMGMMNGARLSIAAQGMGVAEAACQEAFKYASEREQFGKKIKEISAVRKVLDNLEREKCAMRCLLYEAAYTVDMYQIPKHCMERTGKTQEEVVSGKEIRKWEKLANLFTPLSKYYTSEMCNILADKALQVFGGSGYTEDYDIARIYRDARITNIYEGTTQLQVVACIGNIVLGMSKKGFLRSYIDENIQSFTASENLENLYKNFKEICYIFNYFKRSDLKDIYAHEIVDSTARFVISLLFERSLQKVKEDEKTKRAKLVNMYHIDSQAVIVGTLAKLKLVAQESSIKISESA